MNRLIVFFFFIIITLPCSAQQKYFQNHDFTEADTLRGMLRLARTCYDVTFYELDIRVDINNRFIKGNVDMCFDVIEDFKKIQIDLFKNMKINLIQFEGESLSYDRVHNAVFVHFPKQIKGSQKCIKIHYEGHPIAAKNAPWDGGFVWKKDEDNKPWVGVACEGTGASLWWPNKDHLSDEPDSMAIHIQVPDSLYCVANGNLRNQINLEDGYTDYQWFVSYPINNYNVTLNIADYTHFHEEYTSTDGSVLDLDYYVLPYNLKKAKAQFAMVPEMMACYEHYFGKYPFWNDGFAMVETPYLGMEHQGAIAYGNKYMRGYLGGMIPPHMDWDYIVVHETGHEYFGNSVSVNDHAEMWIHESFTTYMESMYVECTYGYEEAVSYLLSQRRYITNRTPVVGPLDVNFESWGHSDHYYKGAWILHTLRHVIDDETLWLDLMKSFYDKYAISQATTKDFIDFVNKKTNKNLTSFFQQYLYHSAIPTLEYALDQKGDDVQITCRWETDVENFIMPIKVGEHTDYQTITPTSQKNTFLLKNLKIKDFKIALALFYIDIQLIK